MTLRLWQIVEAKSKTMVAGLDQGLYCLPTKIDSSYIAVVRKVKPLLWSSLYPLVSEIGGINAVLLKETYNN